MNGDDDALHVPRLNRPLPMIERRAIVHALQLALAVCMASAIGGGVVLFGPAGSAAASSHEPELASSVVMSAEPMLGGSFRPGAWAAVRVNVENDGPAVDGELRMSTAANGPSTFAVAVQLATGARQQHMLYGQMGPLARRFVISLVSGGEVLSSLNVPVDANSTEALGVYVVAERPELTVGSIRRAASAGNRPEPDIVTISPEDLPARVEAWASLDLLVWHDVESNRLGRERLEALRVWVLLGGHLVIVGGSTGAGTLSAFPPDLLPYRPSNVIDLSVADLDGVLGGVPQHATPIPALSGELERGTALASRGDAVLAARAPYGQGATAVVGLDLSTPWLADSPTGDAFWARVVPASRAALDPLVATNDAFIVDALGNLPAVQLPRIDHVFLLIVAYIVMIGPLNYVMLRRRDRREWAWLTMPATIIVFAVAAYGFGVAQKGANVVINELTIVHGAAGTDRGLAQAHVGVFSPSRASFDVRVGGSALISAPGPSAGRTEERPVDVLLGDPSTLRDYDIGFGVLRAFRAQAVVPVPRMDAELALAGDALMGTITNASQVALSDVSVVYGDAVQVVGDMEPGESRQVTISSLAQARFGEPLSWRLYPGSEESDAATLRSVRARRAVVQHLGGGWEEGMRGADGSFASGPVILAWVSGSTLEIDVGTPAEHVGERLYLLPARATVTGPVVFSGGLMQHSTISIDADEAFQESGTFYMGRGTYVVELRPVGFDGSFDVANLTLRLGFERQERPTADGDELAPLPAAEQPDPDEPLASDPRPDDGAMGMPRMQLFDRVAGTWIEFEPAAPSRTYRIADPVRFVDGSGAFRVRFVVRNRDFLQFTLAARLEGTVE